jgi:hypothetical protein
MRWAAVWSKLQKNPTQFTSLNRQPIAGCAPAQFTNVATRNTSNRDFSLHQHGTLPDNPKVRFICIQNLGRTWYMDTDGKWKERPEKLLTFNSALDALAYISSRSLSDARVCICHDWGRKKDAAEQKSSAK